MLAGIKIKPCIPSHFSNNPCLNKLPQSGKLSYVASTWHAHRQGKKKTYCGVWFETVAVTSFKKSLLFASLDQGSSNGSFIYMHVGIPSDLLKGTVRGSQTASDVHVNEAPRVGCRLPEMRKICHPRLIQIQQKLPNIFLKQQEPTRSRC